MHTAVDEYDVIYLYVDEPPGFENFQFKGFLMSSPH